MLEGQRARLLSPMVPPLNRHRCMVFGYQMHGDNVGTLRVLLRKKTDDVMLWSLRGDQGDKWKEGRIILPGYNSDYQVTCHLHCSHSALPGVLCFIKFHYCMSLLLLGHH